MFVATWLWMGVSWAPAGDASVERHAWSTACDAVWTAFVEVDPEALVQAREALARRVEAASVRLTPVEAAAWHRARAAEAFVDGDLEAVRRAFGALGRLDPRWTLPPHLAEPHPLATLLLEGRLQGSRADTVTLDWAPRGGWWVDGLHGDEEALTLPEGRAFVLQIAGPDGTWVHTGHHLSATSVPVGTLAPVGERPTARAERRRTIRLATGVVGGVVAAAGVALWGTGMATAAAVRQGEVAPADVTAAQARANGRAAAGYALAGAGALTLGIGLGVPF